MATDTDYCPYVSTSQCAVWLSEKSAAWNEANNRYWQYNNFVNPYGVLDIELRVLPSQDKVHLFKDSRTEQNFFDTTLINSYTKTTKKYLYDTVRARLDVLLTTHTNAYNVTFKSEARVRKNGVWESSENCITINNITECKKIKNDDDSSWW
jgi:hypothetical protein